MLSLESHEYVANGNVRGDGPRSSISSDRRSIDQMYILSLKVTFQETPLLGACVTNILEEWELGNI